MSSEIQILLAVMTTVSCSFLQVPSNQFKPTFNSTFLTEKERLFKPIIIPNATKLLQSQNEPKTKVQETNVKLLQEETTLKENYSNEDPTTSKNLVKFSSRYSTEQNPNGKSLTEKSEKSTDIPIESESISSEAEEKYKKFSDRSDYVDDSDEEKDDIHDSEITPTTDEPQLSSFQKYEDEENYTSEDIDSSEEKEEAEEKRSVEDYDNSGSKNYHSIQTPLNKIQYRPLHDKPRTRLLKPIDRRPPTPNWPFLNKPIKQLEDLNEISDSDETYENDIDIEIKKEVKGKKGLELAVQKDESKYDRSKNYNYIAERNRQKQKQKNLIAEEEKDHKRPLLRYVKQYQVDEKAPLWHTERSPTHKNIFKDQTSHTTTPINKFKDQTLFSRTPKPFGASKDLSTDFQNHKFLGPVVFKENLNEKKPPAKTYNKYIKGIIQNEKIDQEHLTNEKIQKFTLGKQNKESFNHLEESNEMYNAILANIQSVFGLRTQPLKSSTGQKEDVNLDESKSLTWSLPPIKTKNVN